MFWWVSNINAFHDFTFIVFVIVDLWKAIVFIKFHTFYILHVQTHSNNVKKTLEQAL